MLPTVALFSLLLAAVYEIQPVSSSSSSSFSSPYSSVVPSVSNDRRWFDSCFTSARDKCLKDAVAASPSCKAHRLPLLERDGWWDTWSLSVLGLKTIKRIPATPCEERCFHAAHLQCSEDLLRVPGNTGIVFQQAGRWPIKRVWIFEEPASVFFCFASALFHCVLLARYRSAAQRAAAGIRTAEYGLVGFYSLYYVFWIATFLSATLFHTKDTSLTERLDYFSAVLTLLYTFYVSCIRVFWVQSSSLRLAIALPFAAFAVYHLHYMHFITFDYGYNMKVLVTFGVLHGVLWSVWALRTDAPYRKYIWWAMLASALMISFELADFPPLFGYADAHSIWHLVGNVVAWPWNLWLIADAERFLPLDLVGRKKR